MVSREMIKQFNRSVKEYLMNRTENSASDVHNGLQLLGASSDPSIFDPGNREITELFINIHELLVALGPKSNLNWLGVLVLLKACKNPSARESLVHTFKFTPILTKILSYQTSVDQTLKTLQLLQELSYGIKITWQEAHLSSLIQFLTKWIAGSEPQLIPLSLGILVNLCYKNPPAVYTLMKTVELKRFVKVILKLQKQNDPSRIQISKLLLILEGISGGIPEPEIHVYIKKTFPNLVEALREENIFLMRHIVKFFKEIVNSPTTNEIVQTYPNFKQGVECLLDVVKQEDQLNQDCLSVIFEFLTCLISLESLDLEFLYPSLLKEALRWLRTPVVSTEALALLSAVTSRMFSKQDIEWYSEQREEVMQQIFNILDDQLSEILLLLDVPDQVLGCSETYSKHTALLILLAQMVNISRFSDKIMSSLTHEVMRQLFLPLRKPDARDSIFFQEAVYTFYVQALLFLTELAEKETSWLLLYSELLQEKQVQIILSIALYMGPENIKKRVICLTSTTGFSSECLSVMAACLAEINKLIIFSPYTSSCITEEYDKDTSTVSQIDLMPVLSITQEGYLNSILDKFEKSNGNQNVMTSSIMELYQFKMAALNRSIRQMQMSQEAADKRAISLQHSLVLINSEVSRLHNLLHLSQQNLEASTAETSKLNIQKSDIESEANEIHNKYSQVIQTLRSKTVIISERDETIQKLNSEIACKEDEVEQVRKEVSAETQKNRKLNENLQDASNVIAALRKNIIDLEKNIENLKKDGDIKNQKLEGLKKELLGQAAVITKMEKEKSKKDSDILEMKEELQQQKRMKEMITELISGKKKLDK